MKTIRANTFETNSSSTHSVTFDIKRPDEPKVPFVIDNKLDISAFEKNWNSSFSGTRTMTSETVQEKTAHLIGLVCGLSECLWNYDKVPDNDKMEEIYDYIAKECGFDGAVNVCPMATWEEEPYEFEDLFKILGGKRSWKKEIDRLINKIIKDEKIIINHVEHES